MVPYESCSTAIDGDGSSVTTCVGCAPAQPAPVPVVDPAPVGPAIDGLAPELDPADGGPAVDVPPDPDFDPGMAGTVCLGVDPCLVSARPLCVPGDCTVSSDGAVDCPYIPPCNIPNPVPGETEVRPMPVDAPCVVSPCAGIDPSAAAPERCSSDPCTIYALSQPEGVPCDRVEPCTIPDPAVDAPESGVQTCPTESLPPPTE